MITNQESTQLRIVFLIGLLGNDRAIPCLVLLSCLAIAQPPTELYPVATYEFLPGMTQDVAGSLHTSPVDIDGDGKHDLLKLNAWEINVALGTGGNQFQPWVTSPAQPHACLSHIYPIGYCLGDFDGNGTTDQRRRSAAARRSLTGCYGWGP